MMLRTSLRSTSDATAIFWNGPTWSRERRLSLRPLQVRRSGFRPRPISNPVMWFLLHEQDLDRKGGAGLDHRLSIEVAMGILTR